MDFKPHGLFFKPIFPKERLLGEEKILKRDKNSCHQADNTIQKKKGGFLCHLKSREEDLESMCRLLPFCEW